MWPGVLGRFAERRDKRAENKGNHDRLVGLVADSGSKASKYEAAPARSARGHDL